MTPWKLVFILFALLIPGGSLVMLALATAKALRVAKERLLKGHAMGIARPAIAAADSAR